MSAVASVGSARLSPSSPSAPITLSRTSGIVSRAASIKPGTARTLPICPSAEAACRRTPASASFNAPTRPSTADSAALFCATALGVPAAGVPALNEGCKIAMAMPRQIALDFSSVLTKTPIGLMRLSC